MFGALIEHSEIRDGMKLVGTIGGTRGLIFPCTIDTTPLHLVAFLDGAPNGLRGLQLLQRNWTESGSYWNISECEIEPDLSTFRVERLDALEETDHWTIHYTNNGWLLRGRAPPPHDVRNFWINISTGTGIRPNFEHGVSFDSWSVVKRQPGGQPRTLLEFGN